MRGGGRDVLPFYSQVFFYIHLALHRTKRRDAIEDKEEKSIL